MATNTKTNNLTLLDNINSFVDFMDCSHIPPTSDGSSYSNGTYDVEWNVDNILYYGGSLSYTINQIEAKKSYYDNLTYRLNNMSQDTHTDSDIEDTKEKIASVEPVIFNLSKMEALQQRLFYAFVGRHIGIEIGDNTSIQNLVKDVRKYLDSKKRKNMESKNSNKFDIDLNQTVTLK